MHDLCDGGNSDDSAELSLSFTLRVRERCLDGTNTVLYQVDLMVQ